MPLAATAAPSAPLVRRAPTVAASYALALLAAGAAGLIAASAPVEHPELVAGGRALIVGVPIAIGLHAWWRGTSERFGLLLVAAGGGLLLSTFAESGDDLAYTFGRVAGWWVQLLVVYLLLSFPHGRLMTRVDRFLFYAMAVNVAVLFMPRLALDADFEVPSPYTSCTDACPPNALFPFDSEPWVMDNVIKQVGLAVSIAVMVSVLMRLRERLQAASPLARSVFMPVLAVGAAHAVLTAIGFVLRSANPRGWWVEAIAWLLALTVPAIAVAFLFGMLRWRFFAAGALQRLTEWLRGLPDAATLQRAFAEAFGDPSVALVFPDPSARDGWLDPAGRPIETPAPGPGQTVTEIRDRGSLVASVIHDEALRADPKMMDAAIAVVSVVLDNRRLEDQASAAAREVRLSRARIAASAERERRRIERDLHDGAQQRLVALRIELELAEELVRRDPELGADRLRELELAVDETLEELRSLAHGVYPPLLSDEGIAEALRAAAARFPIRVEVAALGELRRYTPEIEGAVYFCVLEALQNVLKHADGARRATVRLDAGRGAELLFSVRDDGAGVTELARGRGSGITNMNDRLAAVGGELEISSARGVGTTVRGRVPTP
jgi:signal transduction histidine kinase